MPENNVIVIHRETQVATIFSVCDAAGNLLFDYPVTQTTQRGEADTWANLRANLDGVRAKLANGEISSADQPA